MSPTQGRPHSDNPKSERLYIRVTPAEKAEIQAAAKKSGFTLLELIRKGIEAVNKNKKECWLHPEQVTPTLTQNKWKKQERMLLI